MREIVRISDSGSVELSDSVSMSEFEIAELFNVRYSIVKRAIGEALKSGAFNRDKVVKYEVLESGNRADLYSLELIVAISFLIDSYYANLLRRWFMAKILHKQRREPTVYLNFQQGILN